MPSARAGDHDREPRREDRPTPTHARGGRASASERHARPHARQPSCERRTRASARLASAATYSSRTRAASAIPFEARARARLTRGAELRATPGRCRELGDRSGERVLSSRRDVAPRRHRRRRDSPRYPSTRSRARPPSPRAARCRTTPCPSTARRTRRTRRRARELALRRDRTVIAHAGCSTLGTAPPSPTTSSVHAMPRSRGARVEQVRQSFARIAPVPDEQQPQRAACGSAVGRVDRGVDAVRDDRERLRERRRAPSCAAAGDTAMPRSYERNAIADHTRRTRAHAQRSRAR